MSKARPPIHRQPAARRDARRAAGFLALDLHPRGRVYAVVMSQDGLLIGEVAKRSGASRKALRLYEEAGILPSPRRTWSRGARLQP